MTKEGSDKIVNVIFRGWVPYVRANFITIGAVDLILGHDYIRHYSEYSLSSTLSIYITLIAIVLSEFILLSYAIVDFYLFYHKASDMQI